MATCRSFNASRPLLVSPRWLRSSEVAITVAWGGGAAFTATRFGVPNDPTLIGLNVFQQVFEVRKKGRGWLISLRVENNALLHTRS